jgi:thymidylate kinase
LAEASDSPWHRIDATRPEHEVRGEVLSAIEAILK